MNGENAYSVQTLGFWGISPQSSWGSAEDLEPQNCGSDNLRRTIGWWLSKGGALFGRPRFKSSDT